VFIGAPLGVAIGRTLWTRFAGSLHVVPQPTVPVLSVVVIGAGALALANLVSILPGLTASRTPTAVLLHAE
jgi:hypothetical protein